MHSVFQVWLYSLPYRMQSVLASSLRGCDTARKDDNSKFITRALRSLILNNADPTNTFIVGNGTVEEKYVTAWLWDLDSYPMHFIMHTAHAAEIVGYKHPDPKLRAYWIDLYQKVVKGLHLNSETEAQLDVRLGYTPSEREREAAFEAAAAERPIEIDGFSSPPEPPRPPSVALDALLAEKAKAEAAVRKLEADVEQLKKDKAKAEAEKAQVEAERARLQAREQQWDAGTGTSHGGRGRSWSGGS